MFIGTKHIKTFDPCWGRTYLAHGILAINISPRCGETVNELIELKKDKNETYF